MLLVYPVVFLKKYYDFTGLVLKFHNICREIIENCLITPYFEKRVSKAEKMNGIILDPAAGHFWKILFKEFQSQYCYRHDLE